MVLLRMIIGVYPPRTGLGPTALGEGIKLMTVSHAAMANAVAQVAASQAAGGLVPPAGQVAAAPASSGTIKKVAVVAAIGAVAYFLLSKPKPKRAAPVI